MTVPTLGTLKKLPVREAWKGEASLFTPWLRDNCDLLAKELGIDMIATGTEVAVGKFAVDIQGKDARERPIIIENQLEPTDHGHLGQLLTYAGGLDAATIIWVAPQFREEHRQAIDWLNQKTVDGVDFFAVEVELLQIDDSAPAPHFRVVAQPNSWTKRTRRKATDEASSEKAARRIEFLSNVLETTKSKRSDLTNASRVSNPSAFWFSAGRAGFYFGWYFNSQGNVRVELTIDNGNLEENLWFFDQLKLTEAELGTQLGMPLQWLRKETQKLQRIIAHGPTDAVIDGPLAGVAAMEQWAVAAMLKVTDVFRPRIKQLPQFVPPLPAEESPLSLDE